MFAEFHHVETSEPILICLKDISALIQKDKKTVLACTIAGGESKQFYVKEAYEDAS